MFVDAENRVAIASDPIAVYDEYRAWIFRIHPMRAEEAGPDRALHGRQPKISGLVVFQNELRIRRAQHALGVKQDDGTLVRLGRGLIHQTFLPCGRRKRQ